VIVGTAGHIDHGKTALVRALTGIDADRLPEEKARGMTIDLGFAYGEGDEAERLGFVDVPGHERFVHNMLAGATGIDFVLLVVAADDGPMPQTVEHAHILNLLGLSRGVVALSKADLVSPERLVEVTGQVRSLLAGTGLADAEIIPVSSVTGEGVATLQDRLQGAADRGERHDAGDNFRLAVDRSFTITGVGTVVTGTAFAGEVSVGDRLRLTPSGIEARVRSLHVHNRPAAQGRAGQRCAVALAGSQLDRDRIHRGDWLVDPVLHQPTDRLDVRLRLLATERRPLAHWTPVHLHLGAAHVQARVALLAGDALAPGDEDLAQLVVDRPIGALHGDRLILRDQSAQRTIAGGDVLDPWPPSRGRRRPQRLAALHALRPSTPAAALRELATTEPGWIDLATFARAWNLRPERAQEACREAGLTVLGEADQAFALAPERWATVRQAVTETLAAHHGKSPQRPGLEAARLRLALPVRIPLATWSVFLAGLLRGKAIEADGPWLRLPGHAVRLSAADERLWARIRPLMAAGRFQPPRVRDYAHALGVPEDTVRQLLRQLAKMGQLVQVAHDHFVFRATVAELAAIAERIAGQDPRGELTTARFRDAIDTGRKLAIQILDFFDRAGVTTRRGDLRTINPQNLHRFDGVDARGKLNVEESVPGGAAGLQIQ
jgi:selenocysteine-specific elongation factor